MPPIRCPWLTLPLAALLAVAACEGRHEGPGEITGAPVPAEVVEARRGSQAAAAWRVHVGSEPPAKQILFGDLHVHTTISADAFLMSLPLMQGEGSHPQADACDYARYCSGLDFWSINDHAEALTPRHWRETRESIRQCNAVAGDAADPDVVAFLGWEWTQIGRTPETHYGHKNVIFRETADDRVPSRPIGSLDPEILEPMRERGLPWSSYLVPLLDWSNRQRYFDFKTYTDELLATPLCADGVDVRELPENCQESAKTPQVLFEKLEQWGFESLVIPHGTTWGFYTPPGSSLDKQLRAEHRPERQTLVEVYSGHGNSEEYRDWRAVRRDEAGEALCPEPGDGYEPCCWRAGEIIRARCGDAPAGECERRVDEARQNYLAAGAAGHLSVPGATVEDWKDCGQCRDCFLPAFQYRPASSVQYALAVSNFDDPGNPRRFRFGFLASSDSHTARPGTGYKERARRQTTEASGARDETWRRRLDVGRADRGPESERLGPDVLDLPPIQLFDWERQASFFLTGGLVAVHAAGRGRDPIWDALVRREVYGTSGERILLWFDLVNAPAGEAPMGSEVALGDVPRFRVRAVGALEQKPGCPSHAVEGLAAERLERLCGGECHHPGDARRLIRRIEVVRIRPQIRPDEDVASRIEDPWRTFACRPDPAGCVVEFDDPEHPEAGRESLYYVRAIQEPTMAVNAGGLRCERDTSGACVAMSPCYGDDRTPYEDDCLAPIEERAWSSPIYVSPPA